MQSQIVHQPSNDHDMQVNSFKKKKKLNPKLNTQFQIISSQGKETEKKKKKNNKPWKWRIQGC